MIGADVIGLAVGRALAQRGFETLVLERVTAIGTGTSSRNSEVVHAGIYYPAGDLALAYPNAAPTQCSADFAVQGPGEHGVPGLVNLFGIESAD